MRHIAKHGPRTVDHNEKYLAVEIQMLQPFPALWIPWLNTPIEDMAIAAVDGKQVSPIDER